MRLTKTLWGFLGLLSLTSPVYGDITTGLVAWYQLDDNTGTTASDSSGTGNAAAFSGTPVWTTPGRIGPAAVTFNSSDDKIQKTGATGLPTGATAAFTIAGWIKFPAAINLTHFFGFGGFPSGSPSNGVHRGILQQNGRYSFWGANADWDTGVNVDGDNAWHHLAMTCSATTLTFYRDGVNRGSTTRPAAFVTADTVITLGDKHPAGSGYLGDQDDFRIYTRALSATDILELFTLGQQRKRSIVLME